jgi:diguanylate cyclase (GGDEF)-like protein/PAS domain S-box-containing protein
MKQELLMTSKKASPNEFDGGLVASETEMRALFAAMQDVVLVIDRDGVYRKIAPTNLDLLVMPPQELLGKNLRDIFPAEQADSFLSAIHQVLETQQTSHIEYMLLIGERTVWFATSISPMDKDSTLWMARDITGYKNSEVALRESEEQYRSLFDRMMDGVYRSTHEGRFVDINPAMVKMFGYSSREEMLKVDIKNELYFSPEERGSHVLDTGKEEVEAYRMRRKDGSEIWVEDHGAYVHDEHGGLKYHEGILRDITERKHAEDELYRAKDSLEIAHRELQELLAHAQVLARTDGLTGLYNFRYFFELASYEFSAAIRYQRPLSIIIFDTDNLKLVNDTLGHITGDKMLMNVAQTASMQVRSVDALARYGGDEFVVLLPQTNAQQALPVAERIRASVADMRIDTEKGPLAVTLSLGIAELQLDPVDENLEKIVRRADKALYIAKSAGRNRTMIFQAQE